MCVYGMEGPGGYQFIGRTVQMWNRWRQTSDFTGGKPWLLRFFDQIRFYEVGPKELLKFRQDFPLGRHKLKIDHETFRLRDYRKFLRENETSITAFKTNQQASFEAERKRWEASGQLNFSAESEASTGPAEHAALPPGHTAIVAQVPGNVWKINVQPGHKITRDQALVVLESMKMEISVFATSAGEVTQVLCTEGKPVQAGDPLVVIKPVV
jgi:urea carboxylase